MANNTKPSCVTPGSLVEVFEGNTYYSPAPHGLWHRGLVVAIENNKDWIIVLTKDGLIRLNANSKREVRLWRELCNSEEVVV